MAMYEEGEFPVLDPEDVRADYLQTLKCFEECLEPNPYFMATLSEDVSIYAVHMPAYGQYGGQEGDDRLLMVVVKTPDEERPGGTRYDLTLLHFGDKLERKPRYSESAVFRTNFDEVDLSEHNPDSGEEWRKILEDARDCDRFDRDEAWYWANAYFKSDVMRAALNGQRRSEARMRRAMMALYFNDVLAPSA